MVTKQRKAGLLIGGGLVAGGLALLLLKKGEAPPDGEPPPEETQFVYISNISQQSAVKDGYKPGIKFEVDIQNVGVTQGACHPIASIESSAGAFLQEVDMGVQVIAAGGVATFAGEWYWEYGEPDISDWWRPRNIVSEAGVITFDFGLSLKLISVDVEPTGDGKYWVTQRIRVPSDNAAFMPTATIAGIVASKAEMYPPEWIYTTLITITYSGEYEIRGVHSGMVYPGEADTRKSEPVALPKGIYNVISSLSFGYVRGPDEIEGWRTGWENVVVGQVEIL